MASTHTTKQTNPLEQRLQETANELRRNQAPSRFAGRR